MIDIGTRVHVSETGDFGGYVNDPPFNGTVVAYSPEYDVYDVLDDNGIIFYRAAELVSLYIEHADYPHWPGSLYDCPACETYCYCSLGGALSGEEKCLHCSIEENADLRELVQGCE